MGVLEGPPAVSQWIEEMNKTYEQKHLSFEDNFWYFSTHLLPRVMLPIPST